MQDQDSFSDRDSARAETSQSSVEPNICDVELYTDPTYHTETRNEAEPIAERCLDGVTGNNLATPSSTSEKCQTPPIKVSSGWSPSDKSQYRTLSTRGHLSWSRLAQEYEEIFHKGRSPSSLSGQARSLGLSVGRQPRRKPGRPKRRDPLVLKVRFSSDSTKRTTPIAPVQHPTVSPLQDEVSRERHDDGCIMQDIPRSLEGNPSSPYVGPNLPSMAQFGTNEDYAKVRQTDHEQPGSFGLILNQRSQGERLDGHRHTQDARQWMWRQGIRMEEILRQ